MKTLHFFRRIGFCLLCVTFSLSADTLYLKDGRKLEGKILSKGKIYVIQLKYGKLKVKESEILKIEEQAEETQKPPENPSSSSENPPPSDFIPLKPKQIQTYTTDERIEKVVNAYSTNLLEKLFRLESHLEAALLLKESGDPRLIPLIFQKMEELQIRDVRLSLFFSHRSAYHRLIAGIGELPEEQQIPYEELFTKGMKSSNPFVQILSLYGLKERKAFQYSHASSLLEYYDYESLYTYNIGGSDAHFQARSEILSFLFPYAKEILEVDPSLVEKNVAKIVYASAGLSPEIQQNTAVFLLKTWDIPQVGELVVEEFRKSLSFSERPKYYNEDPQERRWF
jgi:hypothetical protein